MDSLSNSDLLNLVQKQEIAWESAEAAVGHLERRLCILEKSDSIKNSALQIFQNSCSNLAQPTDLPSGHCNCVYVRPMYDDKSGGILYKTQIVGDGHSLRSKFLKDRGRDDEKDWEIRKLKADLQRQDTEMRRLKTDLQKIKLQDFDDERSSVSDKFVDKVNTIRMPTISRSTSFRESPFSRVDLNASTSSFSNPSGYRSTWFQDSLCESPTLTHNSNGFESFVTKRKETGMGFSTVPDLDRSVLPDITKSNHAVWQVISSLLKTMQVSVENLCNNVRVHDSQIDDSSRIDSGAIEDELFILKKTISRLAEVSEERGYQSFSLETANESLDAVKVRDVHNTIDGVMQQLAQTELKLRDSQSTIDGMMQQLAQSEFKVIALESQCIEKDKKLEDLENRMYASLKETEAVMIQKYELETTVRELYKEGKDQRHRIEELVSINEELLEFSQAKEEQLRNLREEKDYLRKQLIQCENCATFNSLLIDRNKEIEELNRRLKAGQISTDTIIIEKIELTAKLQEMMKESEVQNKRIEELVSINEELLQYAQSKEDQISFLKEEVALLQAQPEENFQENCRLQETPEAKDQETPEAKDTEVKDPEDTSRVEHNKSLDRYGDE